MPNTISYNSSAGDSSSPVNLFKHALKISSQSNNARFILQSSHV